MLRRILGVIIIVLAVGIAVVPQLTKCNSTTMPCDYLAKAELALSLPILIEGLVLALGPKVTQLGLALVGMGLGISVILLAYVLIGVCSTMGVTNCITLMKPTLLLLGLLLLLANAGALWTSMRKKA